MHVPVAMSSLPSSDITRNRTGVTRARREGEDQLRDCGFPCSEEQIHSSDHRGIKQNEYYQCAPTSEFSAREGRSDCSENCFDHNDSDTERVGRRQESTGDRETARKNTGDRTETGIVWYVAEFTRARRYSSSAYCLLVISTVSCFTVCLLSPVSYLLSVFVLCLLSPVSVFCLLSSVSCLFLSPVFCLLCLLSPVSVFCLLSPAYRPSNHFLSSSLTVADAVFACTAGLRYINSVRAGSTLKSPGTWTRNAYCSVASPSK